MGDLLILLCGWLIYGVLFIGLIAIIVAIIRITWKIAKGEVASVSPGEPWLGIREVKKERKGRMETTGKHGVSKNWESHE